MYDQIQTIFAAFAATNSYVNCLPLKWNSTSKSFYTVENSREDSTNSNLSIPKIRLWTQFAIHRLMLLALIIQEILVMQSETFGDKILNWMPILMLAYHNFHLKVLLEKSNETATFINSLLQSNCKMKEYIKNKKRNFTEKMNLFYSAAVLPLVVIFPVGYVFGLHWHNPQKSSLAGYFALGHCENIWENIIKFTILSLNFWVWTISSCAGSFCIAGLQPLCTILLRDCIHGFWNMEECGGQHEIPFLQRAIAYREIQVMAGLQTNVQGGALMGILIIAPTSLISITSVIIVRLPWIAENLTLLLLSGYLAFVSLLCIMFVIGGQAGVWTESKRMFIKLDRSNAERIQHCRCKFKRWESKCQLRFWKSCRNLVKVKFGVNNFVEEETPLNCINLAVSLAAQFLLLQE